MAFTSVSGRAFFRPIAGFTLAALCAASQTLAATSGPDLLSKTGITLGGAIGGAGGKFVPWGGSVILSEADAFAKSNGKCAFNVSYDLENQGGTGTAAPFKNALRANDQVVALNSNLMLGAGLSRQIITQPYLQPGSFALVLAIDTDNVVAESNETNNLAYIRVTLNGTCGAISPPPVAKPDITSQKGITIGGTANGVGGKFVPWGGSVTLNSADAASQANGKCNFAVAYDMENIGNAATVAPFSNALKANDAVAAVSDNLSLAAGQTKQVYALAGMPSGEFALVLQMDTGNTVAESSESNNQVYVKVNVGGSCAPPAQPDLTSQKGITIGGKFVPWGGSVNLGAGDAATRSKDRCTFSATYDMENIGAATSSAFVNKLISGSTLVAQQTVPGIGAGEARQMSAQLAIAPGTNHLYLLLDANNSIVESNEGNNNSFITTVVDSACLLTATAPTTK